MYLLDVDGKLSSVVLPHLTDSNDFADGSALRCYRTWHVRPPLVRAIERVVLSPLGLPRAGGRMCERGMASSTPPPDGPIAVLFCSRYRHPRGRCLALSCAERTSTSVSPTYR